MISKAGWIGLISPLSLIVLWTSSSINLLFFFRNTIINATSPVWDFAIIKSSSLIFSIHTVFANMQNCWQNLLFSISHFKPWLQCWIKVLIFNAARPQSIYVWGLLQWTPGYRNLLRASAPILHNTPFI